MTLSMSIKMIVLQQLLNIKTYYSDRDLIPKEDLFFTLTLFPLTTLDQKIDKQLYRDSNNDIIWK